MELWNGSTAAQAVEQRINTEQGKGAGRGYERFEPVTVRAAARVLQLQRSGVVTPAEARFYLAELAEMDRHADRRAHRSLYRLAQRQVSTRTTARARGDERPACMAAQISC